MKEEIQKLVERISLDFQKLDELLKQDEVENINIRFPRGVIRTADDFRNRLIFVNDYTLKTNLAYHFMLSDVYRWILNRFDISLTAKEMLIKEGISLIGNIVEAILKHIAVDVFNTDRNIGFSKACTILIENGIITKDQKKNLQWLWNLRCKEHIYNLPNTEYNKYTLEHYNKAIMIWRNLESSLQKAKGDGLI